jgi:acetyl-CoA carboxylase biotin carboxyl carrier protein
VSLTPEDIRALLRAFEASDWDEMSLAYGDTRLDVTRTGRPPVSAPAAPVAAAAVAAPAAAPVAAAPAPTAPVAAAPVAAVPAAAPTTGPAAALPDGHRVTSPSLGLFWRSPQPGAPPFVEVGQRIEAEDTVCIVEVMKLMNHVKAGVSGTVTAILVDNGAMVEFAQPLVIISPEG